MSAQERESIILKRDCEATRIPDGIPMTLYKGTEVTIMQSLGGAFTVVTHQGVMASVAGKNADAIGKEPPPEVNTKDKSGSEKTVKDLVWDQLRTCYDPEIPHNIVDLGLIYECEVSEASPGEHDVKIKMTLTAPGCGMGDWLRQDAKQKILTIPKIKDVEIDVVFDPPWDPSKMNAALRRALNM